MLTELSNQIADIVEAAAPSVVQVQGHRAAASGIVFAPELVLTTARAVGREEHPRVRRADSDALAGEVAGWDPATRLVLINVPGLEGTAPRVAAAPRVGA